MRIWTHFHVVSVQASWQVFYLHCVKQDYGLDGWDVAQTTRDHNAHCVGVGRSISIILLSTASQHRQSDRRGGCCRRIEPDSPAPRHASAGVRPTSKGTSLRFRPGSAPREGEKTNERKLKTQITWISLNLTPDRMGAARAEALEVGQAQM